MRVKGKKITEVCIRRNKVFRMIGQECKTCEEEGTGWKNRQQLIERIGEI